MQIQFEGLSKPLKLVEKNIITALENNDNKEIERQLRIVKMTNPAIHSAQIKDEMSYKSKAGRYSLHSSTFIQYVYPYTYGDGKTVYGVTRINIQSLLDNTHISDNTFLNNADILISQDGIIFYDTRNPDKDYTKKDIRQMSSFASTSATLQDGTFNVYILSKHNHIPMIIYLGISLLIIMIIFIVLSFKATRKYTKRIESHLNNLIKDMDNYMEEKEKPQHD